MSQDGERERPLGFAVARYKQGKCPSCEKKLGESRGTSRLLRRLGPRGNIGTERFVLFVAAGPSP